MVENGYEDYKDYFRDVIELYYKRFKDLIKEAFPEYLLYEDVPVTYKEMQERIKKVYPGAVFAMLCKGKKKKQYITEFYFYLNRDFSPAPDSRFPGKCKSGIMVFSQ